MLLFGLVSLNPLYSAKLFILRKLYIFLLFFVDNLCYFSPEYPIPPARQVQQPARTNADAGKISLRFQALFDPWQQALHGGQAQPAVPPTDAVHGHAHHVWHDALVVLAVSGSLETVGFHLAFSLFCPRHEEYVLCNI